jgi:MraZ protein
VFLGTFEHGIDAKGRLFLPAKLREAGAPSPSFVVTRGLEECLYIYERKKFDEVIAKLATLPVKNQQDGRAFKRMLLAGAQEVAHDEMGRLLLPRPLIEYAGLKKDVSILGVGERIELWATEKWKSYSRKAETTFHRMGRELEI